MGIAEVLTLIFVVLKLVGLVDYSWMMILGPYLALWVFIIVCALIYVVVKR